MRILLSQHYVQVTKQHIASAVPKNKRIVFCEQKLMLGGCQKYKAAYSSKVLIVNISTSTHEILTR